MGRAPSVNYLLIPNPELITSETQVDKAIQANESWGVGAEDTMHHRWCLLNSAENLFYIFERILVQQLPLLVGHNIIVIVQFDCFPSQAWVDQEVAMPEILSTFMGNG